jgi:hypothetical protein
MQGLGNLTQVQCLNGLLKKLLALSNLLPLLRGIQPARGCQTLPNRALNQVLGFLRGGQKIIDGLARA